MRRLARAGLLLIAALLPAGPGGAQEADVAVTPAERIEIIDRTLDTIRKTYVSADVAARMDEAVRAHQGHGDYDGITSGRALAEALTRDLRAVSHDGHLGVEFSAEVLPASFDTAPSAQEIATFERDAAYSNYQFRRLERLDGNIGYLSLGGFYSARMIESVMAGAAAFLAHCEAVIIDLRDNHGGDPTGVQLVESYFFREPVHMSDYHDRAAGTTRQYWTMPVVPGPSLADKDVYVLTSHATFSAGEDFAYNMQALKRVTVVGEVTGGGAHGTAPHRLGDHFLAAVPHMTAINPVTGTDWEGVGVKPDVAVRADKALVTAELLALNKSLGRHGGDAAYAQRLRRAIAARTAERGAPEK